MSVTIAGIIYPIATTTEIVIRPLDDDFQLVLPENIGDLTNVEEIDLSYCGLRRIPESIGNLINLKYIDLTNNQLTTIPESIGRVVNLKKLNLSMNRLLTLPDSIGNLVNLTKLDLSYNRLTTIPDSIGNLQNLEILNLRGNQLTTLHHSIGNLINLQHIDISECPLLTSLPESIGDLQNLKGIYIRYTPFSKNNNLNYLSTTKQIMDVIRKPQEERKRMKIAIVSALRRTPMNYDNLIETIDMAFPDVVDKKGRKITARDMLNEYLNRFATQQGGDIYGKYHVGKSSFKFKRLSRKVSKRKASKASRKSRKASRKSRKASRKSRKSQGVS